MKRMCDAKTKMIKTHFFLRNISLLTWLSQTPLKLKFGRIIANIPICKTRLVMKESFKLPTTRES